ncbi:ATP-dependent DNA helicase UvrD/REP family [Methanobrevibacter ruminantium M1]|uniref:DNA 3'-5' helicase n=1 Tax=Methanobrevibacter ruminantium (strain ATCC 35063 / DSM 1093 / JCM 13430 / OCM 146 / M1) TaxID=634498 RepID=D3E3C3_METRM|nr:ATP-dependent DNA helicase [Methanobrevibacter ruminantium]ADC47034.1 ATP-dependent DNA helicase UvrD/REP family [Methanobrevibacter ruminantium M1]
MSIDLNKNQKRAAYYNGDKYLVIEAGPGAGKTRVLIERIKFLINEEKVEPSSLLVITFTRKAAEELKERLYKDIDESVVSMMQISTIHAFCRVILSEIGEYNTRVLGDSVNEKQKMFLNKYKKDLGFVNECHIRQNEIFNLIDKYGEYATFKVDSKKLVDYIERNTKIDPEYIDFVNEYMKENDGRYPFDEVMANDAYKKSRTNALYLQIAKSYPKYLELLDEKGFSDFDQMQIKTLNYLKTNPNTIYKNVLVDEFQDTDPVQMKIFEILMKNADSFTVVGDIDQSIYGFRGANKNYFEYLYNNYDDRVYKVNLNVNYRSANQIIDISEDFIKSQRAEGAKQDKALGARDLDRNTYFLVNENSESEAKAIFEMIRYLHDSGKIENYNEIAILSRSIRFSNTAQDLIQLFIDNNIPYHVRGVPDLFDRPEIRSVITLIHHLIEDTNPHNHKFDLWELEWLNLKAYTGESFNQVLFNLSDETKNILNSIQEEFEENVLKEEKRAYLKVTGKKSHKYVFKRVFERDEKVLIELFKNIERPILSNENLIRYGVKNKQDLEFFRRLNDLKAYFNSEEYMDSEDTILDIYMKLLTDVCNYLTEDFINDPINRDELKNLAILSNTFHNYELIVDNKNLKGAYYFLRYNIAGYSTDNDESEGVQLMTVHKSKGLEFPVVILLSLNHKKFPSQYKDEYDRFYTPNSCLEYKNYDSKEEEIQDYLEEEDRIVYVAMTRAQDILVLSNLIKETPELEGLKAELNDNLSQIEKIEIIKDIPKGHIKIHDLINRNLSSCKFLEDDFSQLPKTVCEKPQVKKEDFLNLSFYSLENYVACPFKYKLMHDINFSESTMEFNKLRGLFVHNLLETINNRIRSNGNRYIGDDEVLAIFERFQDSFRFENLRLSKKEYDIIKNDVLYYYNTFGKDFNILNTELSFSIKKEYYGLSGIIDLIYKTKDGKMGILDYKNTERISRHYVQNYIKQVYTYMIALKDSFEIDELRIYAIKARKMISVDINQKSLDILLEELDNVSLNIKKEVFECNFGEGCLKCSFSKICVKANNDDVSVFDFNNEDTLSFRNKFYQNLPDYEIIDLKDRYWKDIDFDSDDETKFDVDISADDLASISAKEGVSVSANEGIPISAREGVSVSANEGIPISAKEGVSVSDKDNDLSVSANQIKNLNNSSDDKHLGADFKSKKDSFKSEMKSPSSKKDSSKSKKKSYKSKESSKSSKEPFISSYSKYLDLKSIPKKYKNFLKNDYSKDIDLFEYDDDLSLEENILRKYILKKKGLKLLKKELYDESEDYYKKLIHNSYFKEDYYPYKQLMKVYHKTKKYDKEADIIRDFFKSSVYANKYQFLYFKYKNRKLPKRARIKHNELKDLIKNYVNLLKDSDLSNNSIPNADRLKKDKNRLKILSDEEEFYNHKRSYYTNIADGLYEEKLNQEAFDLYAMAIYKYKEKSFRYYQRLASIYRRTNNYKHELLVIMEYFNKSNKIHRTKSSDKWFKQRLYSTKQLIGDENAIRQIENIVCKKGYNLKADYALNYLNHDLDEYYCLKNLDKELNYIISSNEDIFTLHKKK